MKNKTKIIAAIAILGGVITYFASNGIPVTVSKVSDQPTVLVDELYGKHGRVLQTNDVVERGIEDIKTSKYVLLEVDEHKLYGRVDGYNGYETRSNGTNRYFISVWPLQIEKKDVDINGRQVRTLIYLDKESWDQFSPKVTQ